MNPEIKAKWVAALRSEEYEQGQIFLRDKDNKFCCLGVLCDLMDSSLWEESPLENSYIYLGTPSLLPQRYAIAFSIGCTGQVEGLSQSLSNMNDSGSTFEEIADIIEKHL